MSKISVIIPCYNAEKYIKKCFEGLEKQTFREFDVIVVDDFSTDNSLNILYEIKQNSKLKIKVIKMKQNVGPGEARNVGIKALLFVIVMIIMRRIFYIAYIIKRWNKTLM